MSDIYKLQYNGMTLAYPGWNGYVSYESVPAYKTLTLCAAEGGTLTADTITGMPGDTVNLSPIYNTYWRFSGYAKAGDGSISDNTYTFGNDDEQIVSAYYKKNDFFVSGRFTHVTAATALTNSTVSANFYAYKTYSSGNADIPAAFYTTKTSTQSGNYMKNRTASTTDVWNPTGTISGYVWSGYCDTDARQIYGLKKNTITVQGHSLQVNSTNFGSTAGSCNGKTAGTTVYGNTGTTNNIGIVNCTARIHTTAGNNYWLVNQSYTTANSLWYASGLLP